MKMFIPVAAAELFDKISILELKAEKFQSEVKKLNVERELDVLNQEKKAIPLTEALSKLTIELKQTNRTLWDIEDELRRCEGDKNFGARFVELARQVYITNDRRAEIKSSINALLGSEFVEEKEYQSY